MMAALAATVFIGSCTTAALDPSLESNSGAFNAIPVQSDTVSEEQVPPQSDTGQLAATGQPDPALAPSPELPAQVAALPSAAPATQAVTSESTAPAQAQTPTAEAAPDSQPSETAVTEAPQPEKPKSFLASFFGAKPAKPADAKPSPAAQANEVLAAQTPAPTQFLENPAPKQILENAPPPAAKAQRTVEMVSLELPSPKPIRASAVSFSDDGEGTGLPGVRQSALFEIKRRSGIDDDSDVDLHEEIDDVVNVASAAGMARLAPNGLLKQRENVDVACLKPSLVRVLRTIERRFGKRVVITSGYRSPTYNRRVRGARNSQHMYCAAADVVVPGVSKFELASFARSMKGRGGVGTYCHTDAVHIDVGPERDWNWRCRSRR
ncbi:MAG: DUF882 domain-containing protein [Rhizobiaceae bacterium]|nr:DUF882 domain-containing protein [Rhizobiaceae bacterium]